MITVQETINYLKTLKFDNTDACYLSPVFVTDDIALITYSINGEEDLKKLGLALEDGFAALPHLRESNDSKVKYIVYIPLEIVAGLKEEAKLFLILHEIGHVRKNAIGVGPDDESLHREIQADRYAFDVLKLSHEEAVEVLNEFFYLMIAYLRMSNMEEANYIIELLTDQMKGRRNVA